VLLKWYDATVYIFRCGMVAFMDVYPSLNLHCKTKVGGALN